MSSASSQTEQHLDYAAIFDVVVGQFITIHQVSALVAEPELVNRHRLSVVNPKPEFADHLVGFDIVPLRSPVLSHEHLDGHRLSQHQQRHLGAGLHVVGAECPGVLSQVCPLTVLQLQRQLLPVDRDVFFLLDELLQRGDSGLRLHRQGEGPARYSDDGNLHA